MGVPAHHPEPSGERRVPDRNGCEAGNKWVKNAKRNGEKTSAGPGWSCRTGAEPGQCPPRAPSSPGAVPGAQRIQGLWKTELGIRPEDPPGPCAAFTEIL